MKIKKNYTLVTGGAGFIGSTVVNFLLKEHSKVIVVDNLSTGKKKLINPNVTFIKCDILDYKKLNKLVDRYKIDTIFHFAASISTDESQKNPKKYFVNNVNGTENILKIGVHKKIKYFIFSSTCAVYGDPLKKSVSEKNPTTPKNNYGLSKLLAETLIQQYSKKFSFKYAILRYFNVVGADPDLKTGQVGKGSLFKEISSNVSNNIFTVNVFGKDYKTKDGTCLRDYIDVNDLAELHLALCFYITTNRSITVNCGYNKAYSVLNIISGFEKVLNKKIRINFLPRRTGDIQAIYSNSKLLKKILPKWKQKFSLKESIKNSIKWEKIK
jgi:UDP-glucose 4-epimerase